MQEKKTWVLNWASLVMVFAFSIPAQAVPGDMDGDGEVDLKDYKLLRACITGPNASAVQPGCGSALFDADLDVDLRDLAGFQLGFTGILNNSCTSPIVVTDGTRTYSNRGATTDGPSSPVCDFGLSDLGQVGADIWYCYTASCTGTAFVSLCGSDYDTKLAVYTGCGCPTAAPLACSDDDCGTDTGNYQSRVTIAVTTGQRYLVRVGGFGGDQGDGQLTIGCNVVDACVNGSGDCFVPSPTHTPGCGNAACCAATCNVDQFCCDVTWDASCACEASGFCTGSFPACAPLTGACNQPDTTPGCDDVHCCNTVCMSDPYCCCTVWDSACVDEANSMCFLTCGPGGGGGGCHSVNATPGCNLQTCCEAICANDPTCCETRWDQTCVDEAAASPSCP